MKNFEVTVTIKAASIHEAYKVILERTQPDEDYGFPYTIDFYQLKEVK